jgi:hypothetical protein
LTFQALSVLYPQNEWQLYSFSRPHQAAIGSSTSKAQIELMKCVRKLFPNRVVESNFMHKGYTYPNSSRPIEYDIFVPSLSLALEYQGEPHYFDIPVYGSPRSRQRADQSKAAAAKLAGVTLVPVPFWWDRKETSLMATILQHRPDFEVTQIGVPISKDMPAQFQQKIKYKPNAPKPLKEPFDLTGDWYCISFQVITSCAG